MTRTATTASPGSSVAGFKKKAKGVTPPSGADRHGVFLTDVIIELGFATKEEVDAVVEAGRTSAKPVEKLLLERGVVDEDQLALAIAERNGLDHVDLGRFEVDMSAAAMITPSVGLRYGAVPIAFAPDGALIVAVEDPFDSLAICDIEVMTKSLVRPAIATPSAIHELIERLPETPAPPAPQGGDDSPPKEGGEETAAEEPQAEPQSAPAAEDEGAEKEREEGDAEPAEAEAEGAAEPEVEEKHFEQLGAVLAQRAVPDPEPEEREALEVPSRALGEAAASAESVPEQRSAPPQSDSGERAGRRAQRVEGELLVARRQISDLKRQLKEGAPQDPELGRQMVELEARKAELEGAMAELETRTAELEGEKAELEQRVEELEARNSEFEQHNARLELKVNDLEQRLAELIAVAEEATAMTAKLDALRRMTEKSRATEPGPAS